MRILHLALEDHRRPGSGGGSLRNREINRRLAANGHDVHVVTAAHQALSAREEDGVTYSQIGVPRGYAVSLLSYQASLPLWTRRAIRRLRPDLVVEEFAPPWSSMGVGHWTRRPTVGLVQGYFAREKAVQYHLPPRLLTAIERWGTRSHENLIAVSPEIAAKLRAAAPEADVHTIGNGVDGEEVAAALEPGVTREPGLIAFVGRLEIDQKGLDLMLDAFERLPAGSPARLVVAGDGKNADRFAAMVRQRGLSERISMLGRIDGAEKWQLYARAQVALVPSRYETFGITALEAMACGTPVLAFDIDGLRTTVGQGAAVLVPAFDVEAYAAELQALLADPSRCEQLGRQGRTIASASAWAELAVQQEQVYARAIG
ncbi:glycosyltransferase family 4 protein [Solirubrobacter sp. CPCC 204708]|uniref:Glycosyltransferase family 4 protein n=1 Tax=Solirubrobacter deserti TaxID=2282478 RepID=A0ABT4RM84_9ACTN|nr:glycosyltransferase family 4 protein [Solirubrobacter deserti]MBE2320419.1 glycosyltransferase family 4 protein [Solirubrobacter deserti]MDA0139390.1 glycosyltransferase family 4 protein [Solirubrobacter deserti]